MCVRVSPLPLVSSSEHGRGKANGTRGGGGGGGGGVVGWQATVSLSPAVQVENLLPCPLATRWRDEETQSTQLRLIPVAGRCSINVPSRHLRGSGGGSRGRGERRGSDGGEGANHGMMQMSLGLPPAASPQPQSGGSANGESGVSDRGHGGSGGNGGNGGSGGSGGNAPLAVDLSWRWSPYELQKIAITLREASSRDAAAKASSGSGGGGMRW